MVEAEIRVRLYPTESAEKVRRAILNLFPDVELEEREGSIYGSVLSLERFSEILRDSRIRDVARTQILHKNRGSIGNFWLNKQAAFVGKVNFADEDTPLGAIEVQLTGADLVSIIDRIAPSTRRREGA